MIKNNNKSQKEIPIAPDISKHKKKKEKKDKTPWNKHKHKYSIVLLECANSIDGTILNKCPSKVCTICGRVDSAVKDGKYYVSKPLTYLPFFLYEKELSEEALKLPVWHMDNWLDKQAKEGPLQCSEKRVIGK